MSCPTSRRLPYQTRPVNLINQHGQCDMENSSQIGTDCRLTPQEGTQETGVWAGRSRKEWTWPEKRLMNWQHVIRSSAFDLGVHCRSMPDPSYFRADDPCNRATTPPNPTIFFQPPPTSTMQLSSARKQRHVPSRSLIQGMSSHIPVQQFSFMGNALLQCPVSRHTQPTNRCQCLAAPAGTSQQSAAVLFFFLSSPQFDQ